MKREHPEFERLVGTVTDWLEDKLVARQMAVAKSVA